MRELLYEAAKHYRHGKSLAERGDGRGAAVAFESALRELQAVRPQRMRDVLLAQVYLSRHQLNPQTRDLSDLRLGYAYARTTAEPSVRVLAEALWQAAIASGQHLAPVAKTRPCQAPESGGRRDRRGDPRQRGAPRWPQPFPGWATTDPRSPARRRLSATAPRLSA
jgi:hypothetical protein